MGICFFFKKNNVVRICTHGVCPAIGCNRSFAICSCKNYDRRFSLPKILDKLSSNMQTVFMKLVRLCQIAKS